jgi:putative transposase
MLKLIRDEVVYFGGQEYFISKVLKDLKHVLIRSTKNDIPEKVRISELTDSKPYVGNNEENSETPLEAYNDKELSKARWKLSIIEPFIGKGDKMGLMAAAVKIGRHVSTLYKWIQDFESTGNIGSLVEKEGRGGKGKPRIDKSVNKIVMEVIDEIFLESKSFQATYREIKIRCKEYDYEAPHENTVRKRIKNIPKYQRVYRRQGKRTAQQQFDPKPGRTPDALYPLSKVQIDHTILDIMLVDEITREPFMRPWITLLIDVFSRMILGFYISFDAPGAYGTGRAIANSILPKEKYLKSIGLPEVEWPCWGKMINLHCDNAKEFRGSMLRTACLDYKINLEFRPLKKPEYGGQIERLMGTVASALKDLPGSTKVSKEMRTKFKPEKTAVMTLTEFEQWFALYVNQVYHLSFHSGIEMSPIDKWKEGIFGNNQQKGTGVPEIITDEIKLRKDFLPPEKRTIQRNGVSINKITYYSDSLRKWINACEEGRGREKLKRKFIFKINPHDISTIHFLDPDAKRYFEIPYANPTGPKMSIWDYRKVVSKIREDRKAVNEMAIFDGFKRLRMREEESKKATKEARRRRERENRKKSDPLIIDKVKSEQFSSSAFKSTNEDIRPYDEIDYGKRSFK